VALPGPICPGPTLAFSFEIRAISLADVTAVPMAMPLGVDSLAREEADAPGWRGLLAVLVVLLALGDMSPICVTPREAPLREEEAPALALGEARAWDLLLVLVVLLALGELSLLT